MNPGDIVWWNDREQIVVIDLGDKVVITAARPDLVSEVHAVPRDRLFDVDPD